MQLTTNDGSDQHVHESSESQDNAQEASRPRVLVVDDHEGTCRTLALLLRLAGFDAEFATTGAEALSLALGDAPDAVILDLNLGSDDIPGFMVLQSLRARYSYLPVIVVTGWYLNDEHEAEARGLGVADYLFKPIDDAEVLASLGAALDQRSKMDAGAGKKPPATAEANASSSSARRAETTAGENAFITHRLPPLVRDIQRSFPRVWPDVITERVEDAILEFLAQVKRGTWPVRRSLNGHLRQAAWRNVRDHVQAAARRAANEARYAQEHPEVVSAGDTDWTADLETALSLGHTESETEALRRWLAGESTFRIAEALEISEVTAAARFREVKRFKDRIKKRARRRH